MPSPIPRLRLGQQVAETLRRELRHGTWRGRLPGERELSKQFSVSRPVLREGLALLQQAGLLTVTPRRGYQIRRSRGRVKTGPGEVHLLSPVPPLELRLFTNLWLHELREQLHDSGYRFSLHDGRKYFLRRPDHALSRLVQPHPGSCWILVHSTREIQRWFVEAGVPALAAGSIHPGLALPSVRIDLTAVSRHAVHTLQRGGHKRVALLNLRTDRAGDHESERAFLEAALAAGIEAQVAHHHSEAESVERAVRHLLAQRICPTGWLIGHSETYLGVVSSLARLKQRIPEDVALISREDDPFLSALLPRPARYVVDPRKYARAMHRTLMSICAGRLKPAVSQSLMPEFAGGNSL